MSNFTDNMDALCRINSDLVEHFKAKATQYFAEQKKERIKRKTCKRYCSFLSPIVETINDAAKIAWNIPTTLSNIFAGRGFFSNDSLQEFNKIPLRQALGIVARCYKEIPIDFPKLKGQLITLKHIEASIQKDQSSAPEIWRGKREAIQRFCAAALNSPELRNVEEQKAHTVNMRSP